MTASLELCSAQPVQQYTTTFSTLISNKTNFRECGFWLQVCGLPIVEPQNWTDTLYHSGHQGERRGLAVQPSFSPR